MAFLKLLENVLVNYAAKADARSGCMAGQNRRCGGVPGTAGVCAGQLCGQSRCQVRMTG